MKNNQIGLFTYVAFSALILLIILTCILLSSRLLSHQSIIKQRLTMVNTKTKQPPSPNIKQMPSFNTSIKQLYPSLQGSRIWQSNWKNGKLRILKSGQIDPFDPELIARGNGTLEIDGNGIAHLRGETPRMYVYDPKKIKKWNNVEITVYARRISETGKLSSQGFEIGARSEHQEVGTEQSCLAHTYYARMLYDGRAVFQKEIIHNDAYSSNKPNEENTAKWRTQDGTMPRNIWIGMKFVVRTNSDGKSVVLEMYRDMTDGKDGGRWEKLATYIDTGLWTETPSKTDIQVKCGYSVGKVLIEPGTSIFIRNDKVSDVQYKQFTIREII